MTAKKSLLLVLVAALLTLCSLPAKAQFEFGPTAGAGFIANKHITGAGFSSDLGLSVRYSFLKDAPVNLQVRLDAIYGYLYASSVHKNVIQHVRFAPEEDRFAFAWQDHLIRLPLTVGMHFNDILDGRVTFRLGGYYGRGIAGKVRHVKTPAGLDFPEFDSYKSHTIKGAEGYEGNFITLAQNEHRVGVVTAIDVNLFRKLDLSIYYMGDLGDSWNSAYKPYIRPDAVKLALSYWF